MDSYAMDPSGMDPSAMDPSVTRAPEARLNRYRVAVHITPRRGLLDPQGKAIADALQSLGFAGVADVRMGKHLVLDLRAEDEPSADAAARAMCDRLLANPVTEDYEIARVEAL